MIKEWLDWITENTTALVSAGTAIFGLLGILYKLGRHAKNERDKFLALFELSGKVDNIANQLITNGGSTLRDAIVRIERRQCREAEKTRLLIEGGQYPCFECDEFGKCIYVNQRYLHLVQRDEKDCLGNNWRHIVWEEDRDDVLNSWDRAIKESRIFEENFHYVLPDGQTIKVYSKAYPMHDFNDKTVGWFGIIKEIKENETKSI